MFSETGPDTDETQEPRPDEIDPMETSHLGEDEGAAGGACPPGAQVLTGGMNTDAEIGDAGIADDEGMAGAGGAGPIGGGEGIDDGGTHGGGTAAVPTDEEVLHPGP